MKKVLPAIRRTGRKASEAARVTATLKHDFGTDIELALTPGATHRTSTEQFEYALELLEELAVADKKQLVLYLDEFQEIEATGLRFGKPETIARQMRAILQRSPHVTCLFAGSIKHMMDDIFATENRAMYQFGGFFTLEPIENNVWIQGLREAYLRDKTTITDAGMELLLATSEGAPRATMLLAQQSHVAAVEQGAFVVDATEVHEGIEYAMSAEQPTHEGEVSRIRSLRAHAFQVAQRIALGEAPYGADLDAKQVGRALESLRNVGIAVQAGGRTWRLVDPLLSRYLTRFSAR